MSSDTQIVSDADGHTRAETEARKEVTAGARSRWFEASDLAFVLGVHVRTVQRWIHRGWLRARRRGLRGSRWLVERRDIEVAVAVMALRSDKRMLRSWLGRYRPGS